LVTDIVNITKMKTAGIIPNAIGIETKTEKVCKVDKIFFIIVQ